MNHCFRRRACGYQSNDDRVASINIRDRAVVSRHVREAGDAISHPIVTDDEAETSDSEGGEEESSCKPTSLATWQLTTNQSPKTGMILEFTSSD